MGRLRRSTLTDRALAGALQVVGRLTPVLGDLQLLGASDMTDRERPSRRIVKPDLER